MNNTVVDSGGFHSTLHLKHKVELKFMEEGAPEVTVQSLERCPCQCLDRALFISLTIL